MIDNTLLKTVDAELGKEGGRLRFAYALEVRFEADTERQRRHSILTAAIIAVFVYMLFLVNDYNYRPEVFGLIVTLRVCAIAFVALPTLLLLYKGISPFWREALMINFIVVAMGVSCIVLRASSAPYSYYDVFSFGLILVAGNTFIPLRFVHACIATATCVAIMVVSIAGYEPMPSEAKNLALLTILATSLFTLVNCFRLERNERRFYLLLLREKMRSGYYQQDNQKLSRLSMTDPLTNIANRRQFDAMLDQHWAQAREQGSGLGLLVIDIDHFKAYNDYYGHLQGDECLRQVAASMQGESRETDLVARFGGEEFVLLMANANATNALQAAERIRHGIEELQIPNHRQADDSVVTVSVGVTTLYPADGLKPIDLIAQADAALYKAKQQGRNRTWVAGAGMPDAQAISVSHGFFNRTDYSKR